MEKLTWLDKPFLLKALEDAVTIEDFQVLPSITKGINLLSVVYRVLVHWNDGTKQTTILFFKLPFGKFELLTRNETEIYVSVLPKIHAVLKGQDICPKFYYCSKPENILVLEDLTNCGFRMSRMTSLVDYDHCEAGLRAIARFHAASIVVHRQDPELIEQSGSRGMGSIPDMLQTMVGVSLRVMAEIVDTCSNTENYSKKINAVRSDVVNNVLNLFAKRGPNDVLNHGDLNVNNMMFKYGENNEICDVRLFDFQLPFFGSFAVDLQTFLTSSVNADVLINRLDDLLEIYQSTLNSTLSQSGCPVVLALEDVKREFLNADCFGVYMASTLFCMRAVGTDKAAGISSFNMATFTENNDSPFRKLMDTEEYKSALPPLLKYFDSRGLFAI